MKCIKKMNDFVLGILMILLSAFLVFGKCSATRFLRNSDRIIEKK